VKAVCYSSYLDFITLYLLAGYSRVFLVNTVDILRTVPM